MTDFSIEDAMLDVVELIDEYDETGDGWADDEVREAFEAALPSLRLIVTRLAELYA